MENESPKKSTGPLWGEIEIHSRPRCKSFRELVVALELQEEKIRIREK